MNPINDEICPGRLTRRRFPRQQDRSWRKFRDVFAESFGNRRGKRDFAGLSAFRLRKNQLRTNDPDLPPHTDDSLVEIDVIRGKAQDLSLPHTAPRSQVDQYFVAPREITSQRYKRSSTPCRPPTL